MIRERLRELVQNKPFIPFMVHVSDGDVIPVKSPEFVFIPPIGDLFVVVMSFEGAMQLRHLQLSHVTQLVLGPGTDFDPMLPSSMKA